MKCFDATIIPDNIAYKNNHTPLIASYCQQNHRLDKKTQQKLNQIVTIRGNETEKTAFEVIGLHKLLEKNRLYQISFLYGLQEVDELKIEKNNQTYDLDMRIAQREKSATAPQHLTISATWHDASNKITIIDNEFNVFGKNTSITIDMNETHLKIPIIQANENALNYYGATLVKNNDIISIHSIDKFPIWKMRLDYNYVEECLMKKGTGFYLEWHTDKPHWHQPISFDSSGFYILAKKIIENEKEQYQITGFHISPGTAIYTKPGAIHCDAGLIGINWLVGYDQSHHFSTAIIKNKTTQKVKLIGSKLKHVALNQSLLQENIKYSLPQRANEI